MPKVHEPETLINNRREQDLTALVELCSCAQKEHICILWRHTQTRNFSVAHLVAEHSFLAGVPGQRFPRNFNLGRREALGADPGGRSARLWS